jgi:hypothetical protein
MDFSQLKKNRKSQMAKLQEKAEEMNKGGNYADDKEGYWTLTVDKAGNGSAIIRFLPAPAGEDVPFVRYFDHGFQGPGGWYIEKSLTTLGQDDPASEYNSKLWNSTTDDNSPLRAQARKQKRRLHYVSNIYVVSDPGNPENEGKVFLFEYGKKIFDKLNDAMHPAFADQEPMNPFDLWEGANFRLRAQKVDGYRNYDKSTFDSVSPLFDDDSELEAVWKAERALAPIIDPSQFKSYQELEARLKRVLAIGTDDVPATTAAEVAPETPAWTPPEDTAAESTQESDSSTGETVEAEDDSLDFFKKLANEG